jgi:hypothetical protein
MRADAPFSIAIEENNSKNNRRSFDCAGRKVRDRLRSGGQAWWFQDDSLSDFRMAALR